MKVRQTRVKDGFFIRIRQAVNIRIEEGGGGGVGGGVGRVGGGRILPDIHEDNSSAAATFFFFFLCKALIGRKCAAVGKSSFSNCVALEQTRKITAARWQTIFKSPRLCAVYTSYEKAVISPKPGSKEDHVRLLVYSGHKAQFQWRSKSDNIRM